MTYLFIYLFIWITNGLIVLKVMKCLTKVTVNLYLSIQLIIYFSEEDNSICMFKWGWECISLFQFLSWLTAKVGIKKCYKNGKTKQNKKKSNGFFLSVLSPCFLSVSLSPSVVESQVSLQLFYSYVSCATNIRLTVVNLGKAKTLIFTMSSQNNGFL